MKRVFISLYLALTIFMFSACNTGESAEMIAQVKNIDKTLEVTVIQSDYAFGDYIVHIQNTKFYDKNGQEITKDDIKIGDTVKIDYPGQVMLSFPPQIVAISISLM